MDEIVQVEVTPQEIDAIRKCEAVIVREYQRADGSRFGSIVAQGDAAKMHDQAGITACVIVPVGLTVVGQRVVMVSELIGLDADLQPASGSV